MSEGFSTLWAAIGRSGSNKEKREAFLRALEAATDRRHIGMLCVFASFIRACPEVDKALLAKTRGIYETDPGKMGKLADLSEFLTGITDRLHPDTETYKWAGEKR